MSLSGGVTARHTDDGSNCGDAVTLVTVDGIACVVVERRFGGVAISPTDGALPARVNAPRGLAGTVDAMNTDPVAAALPSGAELAPLADPGRVTFAGDFHGEAGWARHVLRAAKRDGAGALVQLGDFGLWPGRAGMRFLHEVSAAAAAVQLPLLWLDGNHEDFDQLATYPVGATGLRRIRPWIWHLPRGFRWNWAGLRFGALGGATSLDRPHRTPGVSWWPQEEITWAQAQNVIDGGPVDVLLTHDCPAGVTIPGLPPESVWDPAELRRANGHRELLRSVVDAVAPTHLFHGHFHSRYDAELPLPGGPVLSVTGLDKDSSMGRGYLTVDLDALYLDSALRRAATPGADHDAARKSTERPA